MFFFRPLFFQPPFNPKRSKRGCNGGTPCEQCIRREQPCTYSQRRKSGPRGRPIRQQPATPPPPCSILGVRTSSRRTKGTHSFSARDGSPEPSAVSSASSSPDRVAAVSSSSSSSPSDYSASDDSFSDSETESFPETEHRSPRRRRQEEVVMQSAQKTKKSKISGPENDIIHRKAAVREASPSVTCNVSPRKETSPVTAVAATAVAATAAAVSSVSAPALVVPRPQLATVSFSKPSAILEAGAVRAKQEVTWPKRTLSPSTVAPPSLRQRAPGSLWTQPLLATEASTRVQQQQQLRSTEVAATTTTPVSPTSCPTPSTPPETSITTINNGSNSTSALIHEISMQPWEFSRSGVARPVIASPPPLLLATTGNYFSSLGGVSMDVADVSMGVAAAASELTGPGPLPVTEVLRGGMGTPSSSASSCSFDGALRLEGEDFCDDAEDDFDMDLDCAEWQMPSLTREMSLARVVEALGSGDSTPGIGFEGSLVSGW